jgi:hypothetical protein
VFIFRSLYPGLLVAGYCWLFGSCIVPDGHFSSLLLFDQVVEAPLYSEQYGLNVTRPKETSTTAKIYDSFFEESTGVLSGKNGQTRTLDKQIHEWRAEWHASYPRLLRQQVGTFCLCIATNQMLRQGLLCLFSARSKFQVA